jgi:hypothetical protein
LNCELKNYTITKIYIVLKVLLLLIKLKYLNSIVLYNEHESSEPQANKHEPSEHEANEHESSEPRGNEHEPSEPRGNEHEPSEP